MDEAVQNSSILVQPHFFYSLNGIQVCLDFIV